MCVGVGVSSSFPFLSQYSSIWTMSSSIAFHIQYPRELKDFNRALLFTGGDIPDFDAFSRFIGSYSLIIAADSGYDAALRAGLSPDVVIGDMDSISGDALSHGDISGEVIRWPRDKDHSDTELALMHAKERGIDDIILIGGSGGRMDHLYAVQALFSGEFYPSIWITKETLVICFGNDCAYSGVDISHNDKDAPISVFPVGKGPHCAVSTGLKWPIDGLSWDTGAFSLSNRINSTEASVMASSGRFLLMLTPCTHLEILAHARQIDSIS